MGYIHSSAIGSLVAERVRIQGNANNGITVNRDFTPNNSIILIPFLGSVLLHGVIINYGVIVNGTTPATDNPLFKFILRSGDAALQMDSGLQNVIANHVTALSDVSHAQACNAVWMSTVQARRFACIVDSGPGISTLTASTAVVWPSTAWMGNASNFSRYAPARTSATGFRFPHLEITINDPGGAGATAGTIDNVDITAVATLFPPNKGTIETQEIVQADELASRFLIGVGEFSNSGAANLTVV